MLKPLLRTLPTLSGNIKIACELTNIEKIDEQNSQAYVRYAQLLPISSGLAQHRCEVSLLKSSYEFDIKKFYKYYSDIFFDDCFELNKKSISTIQSNKEILILNLVVNVYLLKRTVHSLHSMHLYTLSLLMIYQTISC